MEIYLDHAASTPVSATVRKRVAAAMEESWGNASSLHATGRAARKVVEEAREAVAASLGAEPRELVFTSGATEAINLGIKGLLDSHPDLALITSPLEHSAVLATARHVERSRRKVHWLQVTESGEIAPDSLTRALAAGPALVALMLVNNETGVRTRLEELSERVHQAGSLVFCDAVQAYGFEELDVSRLGVDALVISGHKAYGPKGVGALWVRRGLEMRPQTHGGEQERGIRPGTHDTFAIAGMTAVAEWVKREARAHGLEVALRRDLFESLLAHRQDLRVNGATAPRGAKHSSVTVRGADGEALLMLLDSLGVRASAGSACTAGSMEPSHVLTAMGMAAAEAKATIRFSFGAAVDEGAAKQAAELFMQAVDQVRRVTAA